MIASLSGIRGIPNKDLGLADVSRFAANFGRATGSETFLLARDTRRTGQAMCMTASAALMSLGATVYDYGIISTPALFRESRIKRLPAVMVTASHNEPEFNGLKFLMDGAGIGKDVFEGVMGNEKTSGEFGRGSLRRARSPAYVGDLVQRFKEGSCDGLKVAVDLGGGAAITHTVPLLRRLGCQVVAINDAYGVFNRRIDPVSDDLTVLRRMVEEEECDIGFAFDCDGDRLVIVDPAGRKRSGDYMLTLALSEAMAETGEKKVVVSVDTTQAVDEVVSKLGGMVFRSKVGEANVVGMMKDVGASLGGEGSSGGLIDGSFNYCRDSMLAALSILTALREKGRKLYDSVPTYHQERVAMPIPRAKALKGIGRLAATYREADTTDGLKVGLPGRAWVLLRPSGTEDAVRVSAEAPSAARAKEIVGSFSRKLRGLSP